METTHKTKEEILQAITRIEDILEGSDINLVDLNAVMRQMEIITRYVNNQKD